MSRLLAWALLLAAADPKPPFPRQTLVAKNLGAGPVTVLVARGDHSYEWGPYDLASHEEIKLDYCPCAHLSLELRSPMRSKPLLYPLTRLTSLLLSEDRWSSGDPIAVSADAPDCPALATCEGPPFRVKR